MYNKLAPRICEGFPCELIEINSDGEVYFYMNLWFHDCGMGRRFNIEREISKQ